MKRLFVAEKPSLGRAIAEALGGRARSGDGCLYVGDDCVTWCVGHLLELSTPEAYGAQYKRWRLEDLPIVPRDWRHQPRGGTRKQLGIVTRLLSQAELIVHAGDPDREGQLLVDEVIEHAGVPKAKRRAMKRLLVQDLTPQAVRRALGRLESNEAYQPLSASATARSRADWLYGINLSRAYTLRGRAAGYEGVLSVGRVQTPVLGLVVRRDEAIASFVPTAHYQVDALVPHEGRDIVATWQPSEACARFQDEEGRVVYRPLAENVAERIAGKPARLVDATHKTRAEAPPLPYSLSALQVDASKRWGFSAALTLKLCQALYEEHRLITYPRSDCRYLPEGHLGEAAQVFRSVRRVVPSAGPLLRLVDLSRRSRAWNDQKVGAHHAIIPTAFEGEAPALNAKEQKVYELIARRYLQQFAGKAVYAEGELVFQIETGRFVAKGRACTEPGWKALDLPSTKRRDKEPPYVPELAPGTELVCREGVVRDKTTEPPKPFTDATLLQAMTGIARYVEDEALRRVLKETDGLGTEATRASIIEGLIARGLLARERRSIVSTQVGRALIAALPDALGRPDRTARWERALADIAEGSGTMEAFVDAIGSEVAQLVDVATKATLPRTLAGLGAQRKGKKARKRTRTSATRKTGAKRRKAAPRRRG